MKQPTHAERLRGLMDQLALNAHRRDRAAERLVNLGRERRRLEIELQNLREEMRGGR